MVKRYSLFFPPLKIENNFNVLYVVKMIIIKELQDKCIAGVKSKPMEPFSIAKGETIAIDISYSLYALTGGPKNALCQTCDLPYDPNDIIITLESQHMLLTNNSISPICMFNGFRYPMKSITHVSRASNKFKAASLLKQFYKIGKMPSNEVSDGDHYEAMKNRKIISILNNWILSLVTDWIRINDTNYMCTPFEVEWQCIYLEK